MCVIVLCSVPFFISDFRVHLGACYRRELSEARRDGSCAAALKWVLVEAAKVVHLLAEFVARDEWRLRRQSERVARSHSQPNEARLDLLVLLHSTNRHFAALCAADRLNNAPLGERYLNSVAVGIFWTYSRFTPSRFLDNTELTNHNDINYHCS